MRSTKRPPSPFSVSRRRFLGALIAPIALGACRSRPYRAADFTVPERSAVSLSPAAEYDDGSATNTHPAVVAGAAEAILRAGAAEVVVGEGPGHRRDMEYLLTGSGLDHYLRDDVVVSMPKLKTHHWAGLTGSMKNLFGIVPGAVYGWPKNVLHTHGIENSILDLNATVRSHVTIVDGVV